jgi:hypothetical protein
MTKSTNIQLFTHTQAAIAKSILECQKSIRVSCIHVMKEWQIVSNVVELFRDSDEYSPTYKQIPK